MKKLAFLLCFMLLCTGCAAENAGADVPPDAQTIAERAIPLFTLLVSCPSVTSFEEAPETELYTQAVGLLLASATPGEVMEPSDAYRALFTGGDYAPDAQAEAFALDPARVFLESAIDNGTGTIIASVRAEIDYGAGYEFAWYLDFHIVPDESALFGARISSIFFPE